MSKRVQRYPHGIFILKGHIDLTKRASELIHKVTQFSLILVFLRTHQLDRLMSTYCLKRLFLMILDLIQSSLFQKKITFSSTQSTSSPENYLLQKNSHSVLG